MEFAFQTGDALDFEVENRGGEGGIGTTVAEDVDEVPGRSRPARSDDGNRNGL